MNERGARVRRADGLALQAAAAWASAFALLACVQEAAEPQGRVPTPELAEFESIAEPDTLAHILLGQLGDLDAYVGLAVMCKTDGSRAMEVHVYFSSFPSDRRPVQMAVRGADGRVEHFGPVLTAGPESGFHSPLLTDLDEAERFLRIALRSDSLVSNGYNSFWNRASAADNQAVLEAFLACARGAA